MLNGLFKVAEGFYQVRAYDISNMTIIEARDGLIIIDPMMSKDLWTQGARALPAVIASSAEKAPVRAVIYTHSHADHFGGVGGVSSEKDVLAGDVQVYAPEGFLEHAVSENVYAGGAMGRRAHYM